MAFYNPIDSKVNETDMKILEYHCYPPEKISGKPEICITTVRKSKKLPYHQCIAVGKDSELVSECLHRLRIVGIVEHASPGCESADTREEMKTYNKYYLQLIDPPWMYYDYYESSKKAKLERWRQELMSQATQRKNGYIKNIEKLSGGSTICHFIPYMYCWKEKPESEKGKSNTLDTDVKQVKRARQ